MRILNNFAQAMAMSNPLKRSEPDGADSGGTWCGRFEGTPAAIAHPTLGPGGLCGEQVPVWLHDHPPDVLGVIQGLLLAHIPEGGYCVPLDRLGLRRLARDPTRFALLLVDPAGSIGRVSSPFGGYSVAGVGHGLRAASSAQMKASKRRPGDAYRPCSPGSSNNSPT
jgi:hypothetical protein